MGDVYRRGRAPRSLLKADTSVSRAKALSASVKLSLLFLLVYGAGITIGCLQGYFGGAFDLISERFVEIISNIPFMLVVIIITAKIGRDNIDLATIVLPVQDARCLSCVKDFR